MKKKVYFLSDAHLGSLAIPHTRTQERRLVNFLESVRHEAAAIYLLGDMFDFWHEWKMVVPKGFTRFFGKLSELTDSGIEIHYFIGNHDLWQGDYLEKECGVILHRKPLTVEIYDKVFYLAHGDGLGRDDRGFQCLRWIFHNSVCQRLFANLHPRFAISFGLWWAKCSMKKHKYEGELPFQGEDKEPLVVCAKQYLNEHPEVNYFIVGHRHIELDFPVDTARLLILGDWISAFTYAEFDGNTLSLNKFIEGEQVI